MNIEKMDRDADCFACLKCGFVWATTVSRGFRLFQAVMCLLGSLICIAVGAFLGFIFLGGPEPVDTMPGVQPVTRVQSGAIGVAVVLPLVALFGGGLLLLLGAVSYLWTTMKRWPRSAGLETRPAPDRTGDAKDLFDDAEFWRLDKEGLESFYDSGFRYFKRGGQRVFVSNARLHIRNIKLGKQG